MAKTITIVLPVLDDWLSFVSLVSEISERFIESDLTFRICVVDDGSAPPFVAADLNLPTGSCVASVEIIRLTADLGCRPAIGEGPCAAADGSATDRAIGMDGDGQERPANSTPLLAASRAHRHYFVLDGQADREKPGGFEFYGGGICADVPSTARRSYQLWQFLRDTDRSGALTDAYARTRKQSEVPDHRLALRLPDRADDAQQPLGQGFADEFRVLDRAIAPGDVDRSPPVSGLRIDHANRIPDQRTGAHRKLRSPYFCLSVVIPCFDEEEVIANTYRRVVDVLSSKTFQLQLIFVDDGSKDRTGTILAKIAAADHRVTLITLSRNFGHQAAVSAGLAHSHGNATAVIDADLQDPPEAVLGMIDKWLQGYDVVYGVRTKRKEPRWKKICYTLFYRVFKKIASIDTPLDAGDFSLIDERVLKEINRLPEKNRFFRGLRAWVGFAQVGFEYERAPRIAGVTKYPFLKLLKLAADGIFNFSTIPLTIVFYVGCFISFLSFSALSITVLLKLTNLRIFAVEGSYVQGFASMIVIILFIGGVQLICIGILGEYIGRIYQEVKARPYFIARADFSAQDDRLATSTASMRSDGHDARPKHAFEASVVSNSRRVKGSAL